MQESILYFINACNQESGPCNIAFTFYVILKLIMYREAKIAGFNTGLSKTNRRFERRKVKAPYMDITETYLCNWIFQRYKVEGADIVNTKQEDTEIRHPGKECQLLDCLFFTLLVSFAYSPSSCRFSCSY